MSVKYTKRTPTSRPSSPVHVFVDKDTPVHVYMENENPDRYNSGFKALKSTSTKATKVRRPRKPGSHIPTSKLMRSSSQRMRSISPPWVPPPGKTTRALKSPMGPFWNDEEADLSRQERYEQQINNLVNEVGELQEQLKVERQRDKIRASQEALQSQEDKIEELKQEMDIMERENYLLRDSLDKTRSTMDLNPETEKLIQLLIETELAGERCAHQMQHVFDYLKCNIKEGYKITSRDVDRINTLFHDTEARLFEFKSINDELREMLKEAQQKEINGRNSLEKNNSFLSKRQTELEENIAKYELELGDKDKVIDDLRRQLASKIDESINFASTHESLENVKGHLQQQLKQKSGDCNRMSVQIRTLESELAKERLDKEHLMEMLKNPKDRGYDDRDTLKKAARAQKQRALKAEETIQELTALLADKERHIEQLMPSVRPSNHTTCPPDHCQHCPENKHYHSFDDLPKKTSWPSVYFRGMNPSKDHYEHNSQCSEEDISESDSFMTNSQEDKENLRHMEDIANENDILHQRMVNDNQEGIIISLKRENENLRSIADQCESRLRDVEREMKSLRKTLSEDNEDPNEDQISRLSKLLGKLETSEKSNQTNQARIEDLERKIKGLENQNFEMKNSIQQKENSVLDNRCKAEELTRENASLMRQLEASLTDSRRNADNAREKSIGKDRQLQSRVHETESQLAQQRAEVNKWRRNCEEIERKCNSKLQDMKIQLEQSEITNRSMQTYVQFLKKSYANVFGDMPLSNGLSGPNAPYVGQSLNFGGF